MPQRNRRKRVAQSDFLFVNENADTVTRVGKDPERGRLKQSHVQRRISTQRLQPKSHDGDDAIHNAQHAITTHQEGKRANLAPLTLQQRPFSSHALDPGLQRKDHKGSSRAQSLLEANTAGPIGLGADDSVNPHYTSSTGTSLAPTSAQAGARNDAGIALSHPLRAFTLHPLLVDRLELLQKWVPVLLQYWTTVLLPEKFYADSRCVPVQLMRHAEDVKNDIQLILSNPAHMYSFLANISMQMIGREGRMLSPSANPSTTSGTPDDGHIPFIFQNQALHAIRHELAQNKLTHAIVNDVHCLMGFAYNANQFDAAVPHYRAMLRMISALGGLSTFSRYFVETMFILHWSASLKRLARPTLPVSSFDPGRGSSEIRSIVSQLRQTMVNANRGHTRPMTTLENLNRLSLLSSTILSHANSLVDVLLFSRWAERQLPYNSMYFTWADTRHVAMGYHLLSTEPDFLYGKLNEVVRIALIFTVALTRSPESGQRCASKSASRLKSLLESSNDGRDLLRSLWGRSPYGTETLLWVSVVGGLTAGKRNKVERAWFRDLAGVCAAVLGLSGGFDVGIAPLVAVSGHDLVSQFDTDFQAGDLGLGVDEALLGPELFINSTRGRYDDENEHEIDTTAVAAILGLEAEPPKREWELVRDVMVGFVWDDALQGEPLRVFWAEQRVS